MECPVCGGIYSHQYNCSLNIKNEMDTHDEEFGQLIRKQIKADNDAKEKRDNTNVKPSLSFPLEILNRYLVDEEEYVNYGIVLHPNSRAAFEESVRIAKERIPQLREAIRILLHGK